MLFGIPVAPTSIAVHVPQEGEVANERCNVGSLAQRVSEPPELVHRSHVDNLPEERKHESTQTSASLREGSKSMKRVVRANGTVEAQLVLVSDLAPVVLDSKPLLRIDRNVIHLDAMKLDRSGVMKLRITSQLRKRRNNVTQISCSLTLSAISSGGSEANEGLGANSDILPVCRLSGLVVSVPIFSEPCKLCLDVRGLAKAEVMVQEG